MNWNIKSELASLRPPLHSPSDLPLPAAVAELEVAQIRDWYRAGSEIYAYVFDVIEVPNRLTFIAKALVAPILGTPPERQLERWMSRRGALVQLGVRVPRLLGVGNGLFIEEFINFSAEEVIGRSNDVEEEYRKIVGLVVGGGFSPQSFLSNIRSDGCTFYWTDFGEDLGGQLQPQSSQATDVLMQKALYEYRPSTSRTSVN